MIRTHGLCVSAAVLYQLSCMEIHDIDGRAICWFYRNLWKKVNIEWRWWELYVLFLCSFSCLRRITSSGMTRFVWILSMATKTLRWNYTLVMVLAETRSGNTKRQAAKYYKTIIERMIFGLYCNFIRSTRKRVSRSVSNLIWHFCRISTEHF